MNKGTKFLYTIRNNKFNVYRGEVQIRPKNMPLFRTDFGRRHICAAEPKEIYNNTLWLEEEDQALAKELLAIHVQKQITKLNEQIDDKFFTLKLLMMEDK